MIFSKKRQGKGITFVGQENSKKKPREKKRVRNTAQKTIPFLELYDNGMFLVERVKGKEKYSLCFSMSNTDYALLKDEEKQRRLDVYQSVMNSLSPDIHYQELYLNRPLDMEKIGETLAPREMHPATEYQAAWLKNQQLFVRQIEGNISDTVLYYALSYVKRSKLDNPFAILMQAQQRIAERFEEIGVRSELLQPREVLELIYTIYNPFEEGGFILPADMYDRKTKIRDYIAPSAFKFVPKYTALGSAFNRVLFVSGYAATLDDEFISSLLDNKFKVTVAKHIDHIDKEIAIKSVTDRLKQLEGDRQTRNMRNKQVGTDYIPLNLQTEIQSCLDILKLLQEREELFDVGIYISVSAETMEDLEDITKILIGTCREHLVSVKAAVYRQEEGLASILPLANDQLHITNYLMSSGAAISLPFTYSQLVDEGGFYYGRNARSGYPLIVNRKKDINGNGFYLGQSGSGKSLFCKMEINDVMFLTEKDKVIVVDPEREFVKQCQAIGGTVIKISPNTKNYINPFDLSADHGKNEDAIRNKADLILNLFSVFKGSELSGKERSIVDRCVNKVYFEYQKNGWRDEDIPTFVEFHAILKEQEEQEARDLALILEMYALGNVDIFAHQTNVDMSSRYIDFDLLELPANLKKAAMYIVLEHIWGEVLRNYNKGIYTWVYVDEFHLFYDENEDSTSSGAFFDRIAARVRKYGGLMTCITQNVTGVLASKSGLSMLQNSQFAVLFKQSTRNLEQIKELYDLSENQAARLAAPNVGEGLLISRGIAVPFTKIYPKDNLVYDVITTNFADKIKSMEG